MEQAVYQYLQKLNIPVSKGYLQKLIPSHPDYPSLLSAADVLERLGIEHRIGQIEKEKLADLSFPYLLQLEKAGGRLVAVNSRKDLDELKPDLEYWEGIIVKAESAETTVDEENNRRYAKERTAKNVFGLLAASLLGLLLVPLFQGVSLLHGLLLTTAAGGAGVGYLLVAQDLGVTYQPVDSFCNAGKRTNCDRILNAEDATLFGDFTFSDAVLSYFVFQLMVLGLFVPLAEAGASFLWPLAVAAMLAVPVIGYSLYYQHAKANTWCRLCLIVDGLLGVQAGLFGYAYAEEILVTSGILNWPFALSLFLFAALASALYLLKSRLNIANSTIRSVSSALQIKHAPEVFTQLLLEQDKGETSSFKHEMIMGNPEAPIQITMAANLHCNPCRIAFESISQLLEAYPRKVGVAVRLLKSGKGADGTLPASTRLIRYWFWHILGNRDESARTRKLIYDWYAQMNLDRVIIGNHPDSAGTDIQNEEPEREHYEWISLAGIMHTPTFFINGYELPKGYAIEDMMAMTPALAVLLGKQKKLKKSTIKSFV